VQADRDPDPEVDRLVGNAALGGGNNGIPGGDAEVPGAGAWNSHGTPATLAEHLVVNARGPLRPLYPFSERPFEQPGWNGPYLDQIPLDPWGRPYVVNICFAHAPRAGSWSARNEFHNVLVISAGRNGVFETPFDPGAVAEAAGGDDIAAVVRGATRFP
jgi:hypothetical protein